MVIIAVTFGPVRMSTFVPRVLTENIEEMLRLVGGAA
jgi:hypothetical protein